MKRAFVWHLYLGFKSNETLNPTEMKERGKAIVVGWDFSEYSKLALDHALFYSYQTNMKICLVHIIKRKSDTDIVSVELQKVVDQVYQSRGKHIEMMVRHGNVSEGLSSAAKEISAAVIFIGTHGVQGIQNYIGSHVLRIIMDSAIPFVIVQAPREKHTQFSVVCPIDSRKESKEVLYWVAYLAQVLGAKISLVYPEYKTQTRILRTKANVNFSKHYLGDCRVKYEEVKLSSKRFNNAIVQYAKKKHADLILTITNRQPKVQYLFSASKIQYLIANKEKIPVLCVNPRKDLWIYGAYK
ncbi:universal stress protein [Ancylomarina euxinus]|uniref:Universal stress protein n=2 Tax=Ancylomarina euxinus TaxID=2283627 RepID=A0A425Y809_9BACT|nr:universal stress protein [Ancylomarina euxinus]